MGIYERIASAYILYKDRETALSFVQSYHPETPYGEIIDMWNAIDEYNFQTTGKRKWK